MVVMCFLFCYASNTFLYTIGIMNPFVPEYRFVLLSGSSLSLQVAGGIGPLPSYRSSLNLVHPHPCLRLSPHSTMCFFAMAFQPNTNETDPFNENAIYTLCI